MWEYHNKICNASLNFGRRDQYIQTLDSAIEYKEAVDIKTFKALIED